MISTKYTPLCFLIVSTLMVSLAHADLIDTKTVPGANVFFLEGLEKDGGQELDDMINACLQNDHHPVTSYEETQLLNEEGHPQNNSSKLITTNSVFIGKPLQTKAILINVFHPDTKSELTKRRFSWAQKSFTLDYIRDNNRYYITQNTKLIEPDLDLDSEGKHKKTKSYNHILICLNNISAVERVEVFGASNYSQGSSVRLRASTFTLKE